MCYKNINITTEMTGIVIFRERMTTLGECSTNVCVVSGRPFTWIFQEFWPDCRSFWLTSGLAEFMRKVENLCNTLIYVVSELWLKYGGKQQLQKTITT